MGIRIKGDTTPESDETVVATLSFVGSAPSDVTMGTPHTHTIEDDDTAATHTLTLTVASSSAAEGNTGTRDVNVTVAKPSAAGGVSYSLCFSGNATLDRNGTKAAGEDYQVINRDGTTVQTAFGSGATAGCVGAFGTTSFPSSDDSHTWKIRVFGDTDVESDEGVTVTLKESTSTPLPANFEISSTGNPATHSIDDDDTVDITVAADSSSVAEGMPAVFTITANPAVTAARTIKLTVADEGSQDYVAPGDEGDKTVVIATGAATATWSVPTVDDNAFEGNGQVSLTVRADPASYNLPSDPTVAYVTVTENETAPAYSTTDFLALSAKSTSLVAKESDRPNLHFKVDRIKNGGQDFLTGAWGFRLCFTGTATRGADYTVSRWNGQPLTIGADGCTGAGGSLEDRTFILSQPHLRTARADFYIGYVDDGHEDSGETIIVTLRDPIGAATLFGDGDVSYGKDELTFTILNTEGGGTDAPVAGNCVSAGLQSKVEGYAKENYGAAHVERWKKVLKTFAGETGGMTGAEARQMEAKYKANRWRPVAKAIECLEAESQSTPDPEIAVSGGTGVTEGDPASFTVTADPAPAAPLTVSLTVYQSGDVAAGGAIGSREVTVPTSGSVTLDIATVDDAADEPDGSVSVTVDAGDGYTVAASPDDTASVAVADDDTAANAYAALIAQMVEWRNDPKWKSYKAHTDRWDRALLAFGESVADSTLTPMTAAEAQAFADRGWTRWVEVTAALHEIESGGTGTSDVVTDPVAAVEPELRLAAGPDVDEGGNAEFTITANPAPQADLTVELTVAQSGEVLSTPDPASRTMTLTAGGASTTLTLATAEDDTNDPDGAVRVTLEAGTGYTVAAGQATGTVAVRDNDEPVVSIAAGTGVTEGDPASFTVTATPAPAAPLTVTLTVDQSGDVAGATGSREVVVPTEGHVTVDVATDDDDADEPDGSISATLTAGNGYTVAASPNDAASVAVADNDDAVGVPSLSVVDGQANENEGRLPVIIRLSPPSKSTVSVWAKTRESSPVSARAGVDYRVWNARWGIRIDFRPGETERHLAVALINDSHDEDAETFEVVLSDPSGGAIIGNGVGVMTIVNSDPMPKAWLSRFGRTVAQQALDGITGRLAAPRTPGAQGTLAGQAFTLRPRGGEGTPDATTPETPLLAGLAALVLPDLATGGPGAGAQVGFDHVEPGRPGANGLPARTLTLRDVLLGSSFSATGQPDAHGGSFAFWGRAAQANFEGREGTFALDGETTTAMLGTDYARDRWLLGVTLLQSTGTGGYDDPDSTAAACTDDLTEAMREVLCGGAVREGAGSVESTLTAAVPYAAFQASERLKLWGAAGYGAGEVTLTPETGGTLKTDLSWSMAELGLRGQVLAPADSGPALAVTSDALWTRTSSEKVQNGLAASESDVTRLRLGLEGSWLVRLETLGQLTPTLAVGARHDGGDAETGFGVELGGGLAWNAPRFGLALNLEGRTLLTHRDEDFQDQGVAASFAFDPDPATPRGPSLTVRQDWGGQATGGVDALFAADPLTQRQGTTATSSRWAAEAAWGFPAFGGRFTGSPHMGVGLATGTRDYSLGWRLVPATPASALSLDLQATRRELDAAPPEHRVGLEITTQW